MGLFTPPLVIEAPEQTYSGTIVWTGTADPSGATTHTYQWTRFENFVTLRISLLYAVGGTANTLVTMALPSDCPAPFAPTGFASASNNILGLSGFFFSTQTSTSTAATGRSYLEANAGNNGYVLSLASGSSINSTNAIATVNYFTS